MEEMDDEKWEKRIAMIRRPSFGYIPDKGFVFQFDAAMEGGSATLELCGDQALDFVQSYRVADINYLKDKPVWVEVEPIGGSPLVRFLEVCLI